MALMGIVLVKGAGRRPGQVPIEQLEREQRLHAFAAAFGVVMITLALATSFHSARPLLYAFFVVAYVAYSCKARREGLHTAPQ